MTDDIASVGCPSQIGQVDGPKTWITNGSIADVALVWAKLDGVIRGFLVEKGTVGFSASDIKAKLSMRASITSELILEDARIPAENLLPKAAYSSSEPLVSFWYRVTRVEDLGADRLLYGSLRDLAPDTKMIVNLPSTIHLSITPGESHELSCKVNDLKFFDPKTGLRIPSRPLRSRA